MRDSDIDDLLKRTAQSQPGPDPALLARIAASLQPGMRPVRPIPSPRLLQIALIIVALADAAIIGAVLRAHGLQAMVGPQFLVLGALFFLIVWAAGVWTAELIPGSRRLQSPAVLLAITCAALMAVFALLFRDPLGSGFVPQGIPCLKAGIITAVPALIAGWSILRRGFAVNPASAAIAAGTLSGLAGVAMLELHCPNFQTLHVVVWHAAVVPVSAALAALTAKLMQARGSRSR